MKITHNESGKQYQLNPGTEIEIERTNPFFNEYGEQSAPLDLPDTDLNRKLTGYPHLLGNKAKASQRILAKIEDGDYIMQCRQAILGTQKNKAINTSFYMNEGAFYDTMPDTKLRTIFGSEAVPGVTTVAQAISFCSFLLNTYDERFAIFPVLIDSDSEEKKWINRLSWMDASGTLLAVKPITEYQGAPRFYNLFERTEVIGDATITLAPGYYISPFIKANYLLKRILQYFGYTLEDSFFTQTEPFTRMVFLNKTVDTLVNGAIKFSDVVPNCTCSVILNIFRKKFNCEFIPNELTKTVKIVLFKQNLSAVASLDLSDKLTSEPIIEYPENYKQIKLSSEDSITDSASKVDTFDSIPDLLKAYPTAVLNYADHSFYRKGYTLGTVTTDKIASSAIPYMDTENLDLEEVSVPDCQPIMIPSTDISHWEIINGKTQNIGIPILYIGSGNYLNSTIKYTVSTDDTSNTETSTDTEDQKPMLAFYYNALGSYLHGTISNYNYLGKTRLWDYSLCYFGVDGIFENFYRIHDNLLRNSLHTVRANLLLTNIQKRTIPAHEKVILKGQELLINSLKYKIGGSNDPEESAFFTTHIYEPIDIAPLESIRISKPQFVWQISFTFIVITKAEYDASLFKDKSYVIFYPPHPTALGGTHYPQYIAKTGYAYAGGQYFLEYRLYTYFLTGVENY